jgi:chloramphenicol-sensitive protein RarD
MSGSRQGIGLAVGAYLIWGVLPIYWKALQSVPALQILSHRIVWSFAFLLSLVLVRREWRPLREAARGRTLAVYSFAATVLSLNWLTYIWAVNAGRIVETSLGYFINPLVSVLLGVVFLHERLRRAQWLAVVLAASGVAWLTWHHGALPWVALVLAGSFATYGFLKKTARLGALHGLTIETAMLWLPALMYLAWQETRGQGRLGHAGLPTNLLLVLTGLVTALPLLMFAAAARRIPLSMVGLLQYIAPTCGLIIGVAVYREPFDRARLVGFLLIWAALGVFSVESLWRARRAHVRTNKAREKHNTID